MNVKLLENMNLDELKDIYLCNKYGKDPIKCLDCEEHEVCPAGKRAIELLNEMTAGDQKTKAWKKGVRTNQLKARKIAEELSRMEDPIKHLIEVEGTSVHCARERMRRYRIQYPDLFPDIQANTKVNTRSYTSKKRKKNEERQADYEKAITYKKPVDYYMEKYNLSYDAAWHRWKDAEKKFKKVDEEFVKEEKTMDEISLEDFLKNHEPNVAIDIETEASTAVEPEPEKSEVSAECTLKAKYEQLVREKEELVTKLAWYDNAIRSFDTVMDILNT